MNLGENIGNAFQVVKKTYENIDKLISYCITASEKESHFVPAVTKFLRYRSDNDWQGWLTQEFFLLFQDKQSEKLKNGWRNGPVYVLEINMTEDSEPMAIISKFEYEDISTWDVGCSPASYWAFYDPLRDETMNCRKDGDINILTPSAVAAQKTSKDYWGVSKISYKKFPLADINAENAMDIIFNTFHML